MEWSQSCDESVFEFGDIDVVHYIGNGVSAKRSGNCDFFIVYANNDPDNGRIGGFNFKGADAEEIKKDAEETMSGFYERGDRQNTRYDNSIAEVMRIIFLSQSVI